MPPKKRASQGFQPNIPLEVRNEPLPPSRLRRARPSPPPSIKKKGGPKPKVKKSKPIISDTDDSGNVGVLGEDETLSSASDAEIPPETPARKTTGRIHAAGVSKNVKVVGEKRRRSEASALGDDEAHEDDGEEDEEEEVQEKRVVAKSRLKKLAKAVVESDDDYEDEAPVSKKPAVVKRATSSTKLKEYVGDSRSQPIELSSEEEQAPVPQRKPKQEVKVEVVVPKLSSKGALNPKPAASPTRGRTVSMDAIIANQKKKSEAKSVRSQFVDEAAEDDGDEPDDVQDDDGDELGDANVDDDDLQAGEISWPDSEDDRPLKVSTKNRSTSKSTKATSTPQVKVKVEETDTRGLSKTVNAVGKGKPKDGVKFETETDSEKVEYFEDVFEAYDEPEVDAIMEFFDDEVLNHEIPGIYDVRRVNVMSWINYLRKPVAAFVKLSELSNDVNHLPLSRVTTMALFKQGGKDYRFVNLGSISPGKLCSIKLGSAEFLALKSHHGTNHKVVVNLMLGSVDDHNLPDGGPAGESGWMKKYLRLDQLAYFSTRLQSVVCHALGITNTSPQAQVGDGYLELATRMSAPGPVQSTLSGSSSARTSSSGRGSPVKRTMTASIGVRVGDSSNSSYEVFMQGDFVIKLAFSENVPIYDCRSSKAFQLLKSGNFPPIGAPLFEDDLDVGSVVVAAHTVNKYVKASNKDKEDKGKEDRFAKGKGKATETTEDGNPVVNISLNLLWVAVLAG